MRLEFDTKDGGALLGCDKCVSQSFFNADSADDADAMARGQGWAVFKDCYGTEVTLCPRCKENYRG